MAPVPPNEAHRHPRSCAGRAIQPTPASRGSLSRALALAIATGGGSGYAPVAPGTAGSAVGVLLFWPLAALPPALYAATAAGTVGLAVWAADEACRAWGTEDDGRIVIDEIAGQLVALAPLLWLGRAHSLAWLVTGFVTFRVFDVWKPGPIRWLDENVSGGAGVVLDDLLAGAFAAAMLAALVGVLS